MSKMMWKRRAAIVRFSDRVLEDALGLPADVQIIDAKRSFGTQCIELVFSGKDCPEVRDGDTIQRVSLDELRKAATDEALPH